MVAIPTYIYLGDENATGGPIGVAVNTGAVNFWGFGRLSTKLNQIVPPGSDGLGSGTTYSPWWDGTSGISYTATGATSSTITVSSATWTTNEFAGLTIYIDAGTGSGQTATIASNTGTVITITGTFATTPTGASFHVGTGRFVKYHYMSGLLVPTAKGDNWAYTGGGITPASLLMNSLAGLHTEPTGFRAIKYTSAGGFGSGASFKPSVGNGWIGFKYHYDRAVAAEAASGNTLDVRAVIVDCSKTDIVNVNLAYEADAQLFIDGIRDQISNDCLILLVNQRRDVAYTSLPPVATAVRDANRALALANDNVRLFDMSWAEFAPVAQAVPTEPTDPIYYQTEDYLQMGSRLYSAIQAFYTDAPASVPGSAIASYFVIGDSQMVTASMNPSIAFLGLQESLVGPGDGGPNDTVLPGVYVWDNEAEMVVPYDVMANDNTFGSVQGSVGPSLTMLRDLKRQHPEGVLLFKYAKAGISLTTEGAAFHGNGSLQKEGGTFETIQAQFSKARAAALRDINRSIDMLGGLISCGENDLFSAEVVSAFQTKAPQFVDDLRDLFSTRASGSEMPLVWLQGPPPADTTEGGSILGDATRRETYRSTVLSLASSRPRLTVLRNSGPTDYELQRTDSVHYGGEAVYKIGRDAAAALIALETGEGEASTAATSSVSEVAAFTVEDGSGLASANAYCSVAFADSYHEQYGNPATWSTLSAAQKHDAIRTATRAADDRYGSQWNGVRAKPDTQALDWPRAYVLDRDGNDLSSSAIPAALAKWAARAALLHAHGFDLLPATQTGGIVTSESATSASGASESKTYKGGLSPATQFPALDRMLRSAGLAETGGGWSGALA